MSVKPSPSDLQAALGGGEAEREIYLTGGIAAAATGSYGFICAPRAMRIRSLRLGVLDAGSANTTTLQVHLNGVSQGAVSIVNTAADGTTAALGLDVAVAVGDRVELVVSAIATAATDLSCTATLVLA